MTHPRLRQIAWTLTAFYAGFHFVMTHLPPGNLPPVRTSDTLLHFLSYGLIGGCLYLTLWVTGLPIRRAALLVLFCAATFAVFDEILQVPVGRDPELIDWLADVAGAAVAVICLSLLRMLLSPRDASAPVPAGGE